MLSAGFVRGGLICIKSKAEYDLPAECAGLIRAEVKEIEIRRKNLLKTENLAPPLHLCITKNLGLFRESFLAADCGSLYYRN